MADESFDTNLVKMIAASAYAFVSMQVSRELVGKSYFSLGQGEKLMVDQATLSMVSSNYQAITPELLKRQPTQAAVGFQVAAPVAAAGIKEP